MVKNTSFLVFLLIMATDNVAGILCIEAEIAQNKSSLKMWIVECRDLSHGAFKLGLSAAVLLVAAHALTNSLGGCMRVRSQKELDGATANKQLAVASLILSWIVVMVAISILIVTSNSKMWRSNGLAHQRQLWIGGFLCFVHGLFCGAYFVSASAVRMEAKMGGPV